MSPRILLAGLVLAVFAPSAPRPAADDAKKKDETAPVDLALEINALRTLYYLKATPEQAQAIQKLIKETAGPDKKRAPGKVSKEYHQLLVEVRDALAEDDEERVEALEDQLEELTITEAPELDEAVELTDAARKQAPAVLRQFRVHQVAGFIGMYADQIADPVEKLQDALEKVRGWQLAEWMEKRDALGQEIGLLVAGIDRAEADKVRDAVVDLLAKTRTMKEADYEAKRAELGREAAGLASKIGPTDVLRHFLEHALAEMLSNPRAAAALEARLK
jgi:hypothetical protein